MKLRSAYALAVAVAAIAAAAAFGDDLGFDVVTRFSQLEAVMNSDGESHPVEMFGVVTYVFPRPEDGFLFANNVHYDRIAVQVVPKDGGRINGTDNLSEGDLLVVVGETKGRGAGLIVECSNVAACGKMELNEPPVAKISDCRKGWRHRRRQRIVGTVENCKDIENRDGTVDTSLWIDAGGVSLLNVVVHGGLEGSRRLIGTRVDIKGIVLNTFAADGSSFSWRFDVASEDDVRLVELRPEVYWIVAGGAVVVLLAVAALGFLVAWLRSRRKRRVLKLLNDDRRRIADDLHDNMQQLLAGVSFRLDAALNRADSPAVAYEIANAKKALEQSQAGLRSVLWGLQGAGERESTVAGLFRYAASRMPHWTGVVEIESQGDEPGWARAAGARLLMIMQEAVGNAINHGEAAKIRVLLEFEDDAMTMRVVDDGCGFGMDDASRHRGIGLASMARRAKEIGGVFSVESSPGKGTIVKVEVKHG